MAKHSTRRPVSGPDPLARRRFLQDAAALGLSAGLTGIAERAPAADAGVTLPFANGERELIAYPQKRPLIRLTTRPPQLETPFGVFSEGVITPNDAFFVRYHLSDIPTSVNPDTYRIKVGGKVKTPLELSLGELKKITDPVDIVAVNQCSGNSRGLFSPRANGGQLANGAMGNARWTGTPLKKILEKAGLEASAVQVTFDGLDRGPLSEKPDFVMALKIYLAMDGVAMVA
jgi:sulfite dehydrogenase